LRKHCQPILTIRIIQIDVFPPVATRSHVIQRTIEFETEGARHEKSLAKQRWRRKTWHFTVLDFCTMNSIAVTARSYLAEGVKRLEIESWEMWQDLTLNLTPNLGSPYGHEKNLRA
jgi:hypothetical protein